MTSRGDVPVSAQPGAVKPGLNQHVDHPVVGGGGGDGPGRHLRLSGEDDDEISGTCTIWQETIRSKGFG